MTDRPSAISPPIHEIRRLLDRSRRVLVASHVDPDGDAIGSQLAFGAFLRQLGKEVFLVREAEIPGKYRFLTGVDQIRPFDDFPSDFTVDTAVVLECPTTDRVGRAACFLTGDIQILNIDHHYDSGTFGTVNWIDPTKSSVGEMAFELFDEYGYAFPPDVAEQLYTAILTDTGRFRFPSTSSRTMDIVGRLIAAGANPKKITDDVYFRLSAPTMKLMGRVLSTIEFHDDNRICLLSLTRQMLEETGADLSDSDGLVDFAMFCDTVEIGGLLKEHNGRTRVSLRSRDSINVADVAAEFGGGGHFNAAGCTIPSALPDARKHLIEVLKSARRSRKK